MAATSKVLDPGAYSRLDDAGSSTLAPTMPALPAFSPAAYLRLVRASAVYDVLATAPFATPWTFAWNWQQLSALNVRLGGAALAPFDIYPTLIACLMGSLVLVWSALRVARPEIRLGRFDGV